MTRLILIFSTLIAGAAQSQELAMAATSLTVDGETFTFTPETEAGVSLDGIGWIKFVAGLTITGRTTAPATIQNHAEDTTYAINGTMKNPMRLDYKVDQGWDERAGRYNASQNESYPISVVAGDTIWAAIGSNLVLGSPGAKRNEIRGGVVDKYVALHIVTNEWPATAIAPTGFHWTGKTEETPSTLDLPAFITAVSALGPGSAPFDLEFVDHTPIAKFIDKLDRLEPWGYTSANSGRSGYETLTTHHRGETPRDSKNYGGNLRQIEESAALHLISNVATTAEKERIALALIRNGVQFYDACKGSQFIVRAEGGHSQWQLFCVLTALHALGRTDEITDMPANMGTNALLQPFIADSTFLATLSQHEDTSLPHTYRQRNITAISGTTITVEYLRNASLGDLAQMNWGDMVLTRVSDGATARIVDNGPTYRAPSETTYEFEIDAQPGTPFKVKDRVFVTTPYSLTAGDPDWMIDPELVHSYNGSPAAVYRSVNKFGTAVLYAKALGSIPDQSNWNALVSYVSKSNMSDYPAVNFDFPSQLSRSFGNKFGSLFWAMHAGDLGLAQVARH